MTIYQLMARRLSCAIMIVTALLLIALPFLAKAATPGDLCLQYAGATTREAQAVYGPDAPVPALLGQMRQESSCRADVTAGDLGRGIAQFMDGTSRQVSTMFPELGPPQPYNATWAIRALVRYDSWIGKRVKARDECERWGALLKGYNAGPGYVQQAQTKSPDPSIWFGLTEYVPTRQSPVNFEYSRTYPRKILLKHQPRYAGLGRLVCPNGVA
jgi:soluble lytic murein transglycosylase-like protein